MGGLIPLMLSSGNRMSMISQQPSPVSRRSSSDLTHFTKPISPTKRSHSMPPPARISVLPHTHADWKRTISEVKRLYSAKRYRLCSAKCNDILDNIKDMTHVEPAYIIHLHFYAATSLETCARPLPLSSSLRTNLLHQARTHLDRAAPLITAAEQSVVKKTRPYSVNSSRGSSCHSPSDSLSSISSSSRAWTPETATSSPTNSICSFDDLAAKSSSRTTPSAKRASKKVSFSLPKPTPIQITGPIVRPDSPTLGFDDEYFQSAAARPELPAPPKPLFQEIEIPLQTVSEEEEDVNELTAEDNACFFIARSVDRYCDHLSGLRVQLARHSAHLDQMLAAKAIPRVLDAETTPCGGSRTSLGEDLRTLERQARIERLRSNGWQRKRFDARRYEELCETVLAEMSSS
ncbi:hypothetical protein B0T17DRAFT_316833 [Bombardia bombarda]|uniref:Uncharacterized protein n=1 Tax=Bombardia bombarda TaxID=252184 RepID=A0AA39WM50_9PEZI|nr:hypothetical protein B0T17DRAFT_316833 [Bombardia bombarda]